MDTDSLYLDYNATSPLSFSVMNWLKSGEVVFANPASQHSAGKYSRKIINESRALIFKSFGKTEKSAKLFFHSGATEAFITYAYSFSEFCRLNKRKLLICYAQTDHPAVTSLAERYWHEGVSFFKLSQNSDLTYHYEKNFTELEAKKKADPSLVILYHHLWIHNETGLVSPLSEVRKFKTLPDLYLHIDAVQAPGKIPEWTDLSVGDIWSFSAHKFGALKGIGFSFMSSDLFFHPLISGGGQQQGLRSGTENPQGVKSIALALKDLKEVDVLKTMDYRDRLESFMEEELKGIGGVLRPHLHASNTIYFYLNGLTSDISLALFDLQGIMISAGSACSSGAAKPSLVLTLLGKESVARNGLRLSLGFSMDEEKFNKVKAKLSPVFNRLQSLISKK